MTKVSPEFDDIGILKSYESDEWKSVNLLDKEVARYKAYAVSWLEQNILVSVVLSTSDLAGLKQKAQDAGVSYQDLIADLVHRLVSGEIRSGV